MPRLRSPQRLTFAILAFLQAAAVVAAPGAVEDPPWSVESRGERRTYLVHRPANAGDRPLPLVISLHGGGGNARQHRESSGMDAAADRDGYVVAYPNGTGRLQDRLLTWNAGNCCGYAQLNRTDDVDFIVRLIDDLAARTPIDRTRIYVIGHSNGGMMAHRLGEALPDRIAAIASVAGAHVPAPSHTRAVPVLHIHSADDPRALYEGGYGPPFPFTDQRILHDSVERTLAAWARRNGCSATPEQGEHRESGGHAADRFTYANCRDGAEVVLWKLTGAGHGWPGGIPARERIAGPATTVIDANREAWEFFRRFSLPAAPPPPAR